MIQLALFTTDQVALFNEDKGRISDLQETIISWMYDRYIMCDGRLNRFDIKEIYECTSYGSRKMRAFRGGVKSLVKKSMVVHIDDDHIKLTAKGINYGRYLSPVEPLQYFD